MQPVSTPDVLVAGAGPAGAMTAYWLATAGYDVTLLERKPLPRYKPCGGGISGRTRAVLPFPLDPVLEHEIWGIRFNFWGRSLDRRHHRPIAWMAMRDRFDRYLVDRAVEAGARLVEATPVTGVPDVDASGVTVPTAAGPVRARVLVGADGANSLVARSLGLVPRQRANVALEHEVACSPARARDWEGLVEIDFEYQPWGYGWVFPKQDHISVGVALPPSQGRQLRPALAAYRQRRGLDANETLHAEGHKIPSRHPDDPLHAGRVVLVGDAAGLTDEFSAEGIYYAVESGRLAAAAIDRHLAHSTGLASYTAAVDRELMPELAAARGISRLFFGLVRRAPNLTYSLIRSVDYYTDTLFSVQAGDRTYVAIQQSWPPLVPVWRRLNRGTLAV